MLHVDAQLAEVDVVVMVVLVGADDIRAVV